MRTSAISQVTFRSLIVVSKRSLVNPFIESVYLYACLCPWFCSPVSMKTIVFSLPKVTYSAGPPLSATSNSEIVTVSYSGSVISRSDSRLRIPCCRIIDLLQVQLIHAVNISRLSSSSNVSNCFVKLVAVVAFRHVPEFASGQIAVFPEETDVPVARVCQNH